MAADEDSPLLHPWTCNAHRVIVSIERRSTPGPRPGATTAPINPGSGMNLPPYVQLVMLVAQVTEPLPGSEIGQTQPLLSFIEGWLAANPIWGGLTIALVVIVLGEVVHRLVRRYILRLLENIARHSPMDWDDVLFEAQMPQRLTWGVPLIVWYYGVLLVPGIPEGGATIVQRLLLASMVVVLVRTFDAALEGGQRIYSQFPQAKERPIKGFLQVGNIIVYLAGMILVVSIVMGRSPVIFLSGLGALTAVLLLVFRDTLLSLVAGIQITTNDLLRVGDWIEMPQFEVDGDVVDIALNSVKVQNFDLTFSVIPTHKFLEHSFRNWRGMQESGGRRIKRSFDIDQTTIRFLTDGEVERFAEWELLSDYIKRKRSDIEVHNHEHGINEKIRVPNVRRMTNVGTLRAYIFQYLKQHKGVHGDMTLLVRQLSPGPEGLPIEIYVFTSDTRWLYYEDIQADIFDHVLATIPEFGLRVYQKPSGADMRSGFGAGDAGEDLQPT